MSRYEDHEAKAERLYGADLGTPSCPRRVTARVRRPNMELYQPHYNADRTLTDAGRKAQRLEAYRRMEERNKLPNCMDDRCPVCNKAHGVSPDGFSTDTASCLNCNTGWHIEWDCSDDGAAGWIASMRIETHEAR